MPMAMDKTVSTAWRCVRSPFVAARWDRLRLDTWFAEDLVSCEDWELEMRVYHHCRVVVLFPKSWPGPVCRRRRSAGPGGPRDAHSGSRTWVCCAIASR